MAVNKEIWRQIRRVVQNHPNDMELGHYVRMQTLMTEREDKRNHSFSKKMLGQINKRIHIVDYTDDNN